MDQATRLELDSLYAELDALIAADGPICRASGRCCRFREYGHTLFLSRLEAERLLEEGWAGATEVTPEKCPYQVDGLCSARERRPMGCRVYYCDGSFQERGRELAEDFVGRLKRLHDRLGRDWDYRPLHSFLGEVGRKSKDGSRPGPLPVLRELP